MSPLLYAVLHWVWFGAPQHEAIKILESVQRSGKMGKGLEGKMYEEQLKSLGVFSAEQAEWRPHDSLQLHTGSGGHL